MLMAASVFEVYTHEGSPQGNMLSLLYSESLIFPGWDEGCVQDIMWERRLTPLLL